MTTQENQSITKNLIESIKALAATESVTLKFIKSLVIGDRSWFLYEWVETGESWFALRSPGSMLNGKASKDLVDEIMA